MTDHNAEQVVVERVPHIVGDVVGDHRPVEGIATDLITCRCDGAVWEVQDWQRHVGHAVVAALAEDRAAYGLPPGSPAPDAAA